MDSEFENETMTESNLEEIEERIPKFNGDEIVKKYYKGRFLGKGGFAKCYELKCVHNKKIYAGKIISKSNIIKPSAKTKLKSEIKIHKSLTHQNIVKFEHYFEDGNNVYILLELCKSKTLNELLKKRKIISEIEVRYYLNQILQAVKYMHKNKIIHRDLKLGNLFLSGTLEIKIGDFGLATRIEYDDERKYTICGTPNYIAPEILEGKNTGHSYEVDYWAIGVIVYTLIIGRPPFETDDVKETYKKINANNYSFPSHVFISDIAKDFIKKLLVTNPSNRLTPDMMYTHPFMANTPIPKELPHYTLCNPPKVDFFRSHQSECEPITSATQLSFDQDKENLAILRDFALKNIKQTKKDMNKCFMVLNKPGSSISNKLDLSQLKEKHQLLTKKLEKIDMKKLLLVDILYDYSDKFGILYKMSAPLNIIGCVFNDKSVLFKYPGSKANIYYENKKKGLIKPKVFDSKNVISEIKQKHEILCNFEKFLGLKPNSSQNNTKENPMIYVKKIIKSDLAILLKLSNKMIQLTFKDTTKLLIDNELSHQVFFFDKNKNYHYSVHFVNKSNNKRFINRYEHYKKIFFEKMEERFQKNQQIKELESPRNDLNNTT